MQLNGLLYGGGFTLLGLQTLAACVIALWSAVCSFVILYTLQHSPIGLRISKYDEELGADLREHGLSGQNIQSYRVEKKITAQFVNHYRVGKKGNKLQTTLCSDDDNCEMEDQSQIGSTKEEEISRIDCCCAGGWNAATGIWRECIRNAIGQKETKQCSC